MVEGGRLRARAGTGKEATGREERDEAMDTERSEAEEALPAAEREEAEEDDNEVDAAEEDEAAVAVDEIVDPDVEETAAAEEGAAGAVAAAEVDDCAGGARPQCFCVCA